MRWSLLSMLSNFALFVPKSRFLVSLLFFVGFLVINTHLCLIVPLRLRTHIFFCSTLLSRRYSFIAFAKSINSVDSCPIICTCQKKAVTLQPKVVNTIDVFDEKNIYDVYHRVVSVLTKHLDIETTVLEAMSYCFYEILDNVLTHSGKERSCICSCKLIRKLTLLK